MAVDGVVKVTTTNPASNAEGFAVRQVGVPSAEAGGDSISNPTTVGQLGFGLQWNATTWERARGNLDGTALSISQRTAGTVESADIINYGHCGAHVVLHYSSGAAILLLRVQGKDELSDVYYNLTSAVSISATSTAVFKIYPGLSANAAGITGQSVNDVLPRTWRVTIVPSGSATATYGVGYSLIK